MAFTCKKIALTVVASFIAATAAMVQSADVQSTEAQPEPTYSYGPMMGYDGYGMGMMGGYYDYGCPWLNQHVATQMAQQNWTQKIDKLQGNLNLNDEQKAAFQQYSDSLSNLKSLPDQPKAEAANKQEALNQQIEQLKSKIAALESVAKSRQALIDQLNGNQATVLENAEAGTPPANPAMAQPLPVPPTGTQDQDTGPYIIYLVPSGQ